MRLCLLLTVLFVSLAGCGNRDKSLSKTAGNKVGQSVTDFASGVGEGFDQVIQVKVDLSKQLTDRGLSKTAAKYKINPNQKVITVYVIAAKPFKGKITAKAFAKGDQEIGRSVAEVDFSTDDAKYVDFTFDSAMDTHLVEKYVLDEKK